MRDLLGIETIFVHCCIYGKQKLTASGAAGGGGGVGGHSVGMNISEEWLWQPEISKKCNLLKQ